MLSVHPGMNPPPAKFPHAPSTSGGPASQEYTHEVPASHGSDCPPSTSVGRASRSIWLASASLWSAPASTWPELASTLLVSVSRTVTRPHAPVHNASSDAISPLQFMRHSIPISQRGGAGTTSRGHADGAPRWTRRPLLANSNRMRTAGGESRARFPWRATSCRFSPQCFWTERPAPSRATSRASWAWTEPFRS